MVDWGDMEILKNVIVQEVNVRQNTDYVVGGIRDIGKEGIGWGLGDRGFSFRFEVYLVGQVCVSGLVFGFNIFLGLKVVRLG